MSDFVSAQYTIDEIKNVLNNQMNGLAAIKSTEETIDGRLTDNSTGLSALKLATTTVDDKLSNATYGLAAIKGLLNTTDGRLTNGTNGLSAIKSAVDASNNYLSNATYGLSALKNAITESRACVKSMQKGSVTGTTGSGGIQIINVTISSVNANKCIVLVYGDNQQYEWGILTSSTNLEMHIPGHTSNIAYWQVVEFY